MRRRAVEIAAQTGAFATDQLHNPDMVDSYRRLGEELLQQLPGVPSIAAFCCYVGTAGCFLGVTATLRSALPALRRVAVEPAEGRTVRRSTGHPPHRGRRHRLPPAAAETGRR